MHARTPCPACSSLPAGWPLVAGLAAGALADALIGDPARCHPVALFGRAATALEQAVYADRKPAGAAFAAASLVLGAGPVLAAARLARRRPLAPAVITATVTALRAVRLGISAPR